MKCVVPGVNLKVFGRAIHSLAKIGDEVYFEPLEQGLSLRTVNSSRSAYACFLFFPSYFQHYDDGSREDEAGRNSEEEEEGLRCKITVKSIMAVFRSLSTIEKTVEKCKISHNAREARLVFELHCRHGIVKTHNLAYIECETLQAIFSKDMCPNKLSAPSKLFCDVVVNFQTTQEEITLTVRPESLSLKNYVEDEPDPNKVVHTELNLAPEEFDLYQVGVDTDITFCLKELRAILAFGETTGLPININFESAGRPVTFCIDSDQTFEANFVLATLADVDQSSSQMPASQRSQQAASTSQHHAKHAANSKQHKAKDVSVKKESKRKESTKTDRHRDQELNRNQPQPSSSAANDVDNMADISAEEFAAAMEAEEDWETEEQTENNPQDRITDQQTLQGAETDDTTQKEGRVTETNTSPGETKRKEGRVTETDTNLQGGWLGKSLHEEREVEEEEGEEEEGRNRGGLKLNGAEGRSSSSPVIPVQCPSSGKKREGPCLQPLDDDDNDDLDETIPGTPPAKKFRSLFFGSSQKASQSTQPQQNNTVLAAETDEED
ncbi:cell cycle checkpoint control protein RAD9A-like isoform X2 [Littorina saxatilis]|uniref:Cell cycle checkpoint control protein RAD9A n=1 Tax=Littorina saxatilis TaxID=31220 RepID=A0AAN9AHT0_9CAEN